MNVRQSTSTTSIFFLKYITQGVLCLALIVLAFIGLQQLEFTKEINLALRPIYENVTLMYTIYSFSEIFCGILPPELFIIWGLRSQSITDYITIVIVLASISYLAGVIGFYFGRLLGTTVYFRYLRKRFLAKHHKNLMIYGSVLIVIAALTPVPYSGVCILSGASNYPRNKFLLYAATRFIRYAIYAVVIWNSHINH